MRRYRNSYHKKTTLVKEDVEQKTSYKIKQTEPIQKLDNLNYIAEAKLKLGLRRENRQDIGNMIFGMEKKSDETLNIPGLKYENPESQTSRSALGV